MGPWSAVYWGRGVDIVEILLVYTPMMPMALDQRVIRKDSAKRHALLGGHRLRLLKFESKERSNHVLRPTLFGLEV